jgi:F420H(2)-dependent quinone reductase
MCQVRVVRLANPLVRAVLRSRWHRMLSDRLLVLTYTGRRSGRRFEIPVRYAETEDGRLVVVAVRPERKLWWRSFQRSATAAVTLRGERIGVEGALQTGSPRDAAFGAYLRRYPRSARLVRKSAIVVFVPRR